MKKNALVAVKNIICFITVVWAGIVLVEYTVVLLPFKPSGFLFDIFDFFVIFLFIGIWAVPLLLLISLIFMAVVRKKYNNTDKAKWLNTLAVVLPVIAGVLMLITDFNSRLQ